MIDPGYCTEVLLSEGIEPHVGVHCRSQENGLLIPCIPGPYYTRQQVVTIPLQQKDIIGCLKYNTLGCGVWTEFVGGRSLV